jgi:hypothetical protein
MENGPQGNYNPMDRKIDISKMLYVAIMIIVYVIAI